MKKNLTIIFLFIALAMNAQTVMTFSKEQAQFVKDLDYFLSLTKNEQTTATFNEFNKLVKEGKISAAWFEPMSKTCNTLAERRMSALAHYNPYLEAVIAAAKNGVSDAQFISWNSFVGDIIDAQKKGDNNPFLKTMDFSNSFFSENAFHATLAKKWKTETKDCKFNSDGLRPFVSFGTTNVTGEIKDDTIRINQTSGNYFPLEAKWEGKGGKVDWGRTGMDANKVFAVLKNYSINCTTLGYTADTVTFTYTDFFKSPLVGKLTDKLVSNADSSRITYPRFESYEMAITVKDIAPGVSYVGGFSLQGSKVLGTGNTEVEPQLDFYERGRTKKIMTVRSPAISIKKGEEVGATKAEVIIYFGNDSIYHPQLDVIYKAAKREVRLLRGESGLSKAKFTDSYHNQDFQTDAIYWNLDSSILNLKILSGVGQKPGVYESVNYFNKELIRKTQGYTSYQPLTILKKMVEQSGDYREINSLDFARAIDPNLKEGQVKSLLYELIENGFILFNEETGVITVKDKTMNYVLANAKKIDYDIIHISSLPKTGNDYIDIANNDIALKGVKQVPISDTAFVYFQPKDGALNLQKDRDMLFDGVIYAGRTDLTGKEFHFNYKPFTVDLKQVDTMVLYIPDSAGTLDKNGNPVLVPMKSRIENIHGLLEVDAPINKSGRTRLVQFPKLHSKEKSNIYYDDPAIAKGAYTRNNFTFELLPFRLDSMGIFSPGMVNWPGTLHSADIFPDIENRISIQKDLSLGFKGEAPENGFPLYKDKGMYYGKYELNYGGLQGDGRITHSTADFTSHDIHLYPDSLRGTTDTFRIAKTFEGVKTPAVVGTSDMVFWKPLSDTMFISMLNNDQPFAMYDTGFTTFRGNLLLSSSGLGGDGTLDWDEASLSSKSFSFKTMALSADTAALNIKTTGDKVSFKTPNVSAKVDFETRIGDFVSNEKNIPTEFSYNKYTTAINQFKWLMDEKILDFRAPQGEGEYFTSIKPEQKGLFFLGKRAIYYLSTSLLRIEQVPEIRVADASVVPDSGIVIIEEDAKMNQLRNAVIIADTTHKHHRIENCVVDIYSKNELKAIGDYHFNTKGIKEIINFSDISCKRDAEGKGKREKEFYTLTATANLDEQKNFIIYPDVNFNGEAKLFSQNPLLNFKGFAKIDLKHPKANTSDFFINQEINPDTLALKFDTTAKSATGNRLSAGIHLNPSPDAPAAYTTLLAPKQEKKDITLFSSTGVVAVADNGEYLFGDSAKIKDNAVEGNLLRYDDKKGTVKAEGKFDFGTNFGLIKTLAAGDAEVKLDSAKYKFNLTFGIDLRMEDKMQERFDFYMAGDNADQPDINYDTEKQRLAIRNLSDAKDDKKMLEEFNNTTAFTKRPKELTHNLVFNNVTFVYDSEDISLRSIGKIGVALSGKKVINKVLNGYIEYQYKGGLDVFTIYIETGTKDWFFFEYRPGQLGAVSSYSDFNNTINLVAPAKRKITGANNRFYMYTLGSTMNKEDFVQYMKDKEAGIVRVRPEPRIELPPIIEEDTSGVLIGDSTIQQTEELIDPRKAKRERKEPDTNAQPSDEPAAVPPPTDRRKAKKGKPAQEEIPQQEEITPEMIQRERERQQERQEMERMRQEGGGIFSAPPPGREQPKQEEPVQEQPKEEIAPQEILIEETPVQEEIPQEETPVEEAVPVQEQPQQEEIQQIEEEETPE